MYKGDNDRIIACVILVFEAIRSNFKCLFYRFYIKGNIMTKIIAHRGVTGDGRAENTIEAFKKAIELGLDMVEFDVRRTKDNFLIVYHDSTLNDYPVKLTNYETLKSEALKNGFELPLFKDALKVCAGNIFMDIEVKERGFEHKLLRELDKYAAPDQYSIKSFDDRISYVIKQLRPEITTGLLIGKSKAGFKRRLNEYFPIRRLKACKADFVSPNYRLMTSGFVKRLKNAGFPIYVWTVNDKKIIIKALTFEVDGIITDKTDKVMKYMN